MLTEPDGQPVPGPLVGIDLIYSLLYPQKEQGLRVTRGDLVDEFETNRTQIHE